MENTCNGCIHLRQIMKHPWNKGDAAGSVSEIMGWICDIPLADNPIFMDNIRWGCEMYYSEEKQESNNNKNKN